LAEYKNTKTFILDLNYRSTKNILKTANTLISNNNDRIKKNLITDNMDGNNVFFYKGDSVYQEANYVVKQIVNLTKNKRFAFKDVVILYRAKYLSRSIEQELISNGIPYYVFGAVRFYQRREIKDLVAYLKLVVNPMDELSLKRILNVPSRGIGSTTIDSISKYANDQHISFVEAFYLTTNLEFEPP
jgi:DNA helicase-2/ATP-dependent DNA helicase PcrA